MATPKLHSTLVGGGVRKSDYELRAQIVTRWDSTHLSHRCDKAHPSQIDGHKTTRSHSPHSPELSCAVSGHRPCAFSRECSMIKKTREGLPAADTGLKRSLGDDDLSP